ncbi:MAG: selenocysteine-specific translation elongation factor [Planctomycetes bacterium]|nr:selenocysteine-specific translation elongation factor [Planctomycetota bacterium]
MAAPPLKSSDIYNVIIGTAGHIDHGKSTLVKRLTGIDPDRLPEEKEREMTIDLGFAPFTLKTGQRVGIIDVPGHERFIKNMVAGATSIDLVLLVVAGDEGPNIQTREHVSIMQLLGLKRGILVITKADKADPDFVELVKDDLQKLVHGTFLEGAPMIAVSAFTGQGIDLLVETINSIVLSMPTHETQGVFRMPIQRIFSAKGFGTIITGVPISGQAKIGDTLEILPLGRRGRVRALQAYKAEVQEIRAGHSSAVNITDIAHEEVQRGMVACTPGYFKASLFVEARFKYVPDIPRPLRNLMPVKFHAGTKEADGRIVLLDKKELAPGEECYVQFRLDEPVVVATGDPFIVRLQTPMYTIGGGRVLEASDGKIKRFKDEILMKLVEKEAAISDQHAAVEVVLKQQGDRAVTLADLSVATQQPPAAIEPAVKQFEAAGKLVKFDGNRFMHADAFEGTMQRLKGMINQFHVKHPLRAGWDMLVFRTESKLGEDVFRRASEELVKRGVLAIENNKARAASFSVRLSREDADAAAEVERLVRETAFNTPRLDEIHGRFKYNKERIDRVLGLLVDKGAIVQLKDGVLFHRDTVEEAKRVIAEAIRRQGAIEAAQVRDLIGTTRKYVIPLLEYLDDVGFTVRVENKRVLKNEPDSGRRPIR